MLRWAGASRISREKTSPQKENEDSMLKILKALDLKKNGKVKIQSFIDVMESNNVDVDQNEIVEMFSLADNSEDIGINAFCIYIKNSSLWKDKLEKR